MSMAAKASAALRVSRFSCVNRAFLASCWVRVLPPSASDRVRRSYSSARKMAPGSMPLWVMKCSSSVQITACT